MTIIILKGKTAKARQRIKDHGEAWEVIESPVVPAPSQFLKSVKTGDARWLTEQFEIVEIQI